MSANQEIEIEKARDVTRADDLEVKEEIAHEDAAVDLKAQGNNTSVGLAVIDQFHTIPTTGARKVTTKLEYWTYCAFCEFQLSGTLVD